MEILKVNNLSAEEIASQARNPYYHWQSMEPEEKREILEVITGKITVAKDEITISHYYTLKYYSTYPTQLLHIFL